MRRADHVARPFSLRGRPVPLNDGSASTAVILPVYNGIPVAQTPCPEINRSHSGSQDRDILPTNVAVQSVAITRTPTP